MFGILYIVDFSNYLMATKRIRKNTQRNMFKRSVTGKKPMKPEEKAAREKLREAQIAKVKESKSE